MAFRIAVVDRPDSAVAPGGDTVQIQALARCLTGRGHHAEVLAGSALDSAAFDLALLFNLTRSEEAFVQASACVARGKPYVLFPVYWDMDQAIPPSAYPGGWARLTRAVLRVLPESVRDAARRGFRGGKIVVQASCLPKEVQAGSLHLKSGELRSIKIGTRRTLDEFTLLYARLICVNSQAEAEHLKARYPAAADAARLEVVPNGLWAARVAEADRAGGVRERRVLCAGGLGPRKNQWGLVRAARGLDAPVWIVGRAAAGQAGYAEAVRRASPPNVRFLDWQAPEALWTLMRSSAVFAQPSFIETPGLAALEAGALGCRLVLGDVGPVREYFRDEAVYVRPESPDAIRAGLRAALAAGPAPEAAAARLRETYAWETCLQPFAARVEGLLA